MDSIRFSEKYWMIYRQNTFGFATILDLKYKKSYVEVLLFPNTDVIEKGVPLIKIYTPIETQVDFEEILIDPDFDEDGLISPSKVIMRINKLINEEINYHTKILGREIELIDEKYENYPIDNIPFFRKIIIYFPDFEVELKINFEDYPFKPKIFFSRFLSKLINQKKFMQEDIFTNWSELSPNHIVDILDLIVDQIIRKFKLIKYYKDFQTIFVKKLRLGKNIRDVSLKIHRGQTIGILYQIEFNQYESHTKIIELFEVIAGRSTKFSGEVKIFGKFIQLLAEEERNKIFILPEVLSSKLINMKIKKAIKYDIKVISEWRSQQEILNEKLRQLDLLTLIDEWVSRGPLWKIFSRIRRILKKREFIESILKLTGLSNKRKKRVGELTPLDYLFFSIGRALLQSPSLIMFSIPEGLLNRLEYEKFNSFINDIKKEFHIPLIIHGPEGIIKNCEKIITITQEKSEYGTKEELINKIPQSGELITIELNYPDEDDLKKMYEMDSFIVLEERKNEKYKIFPKRNPNEIIKDLIGIFGADLYCFKKYTASLEEFVEFLEITS
ncbi:MAG: hypothetical protein GF316_13010 [Candidatus Lokiarchaeota archaeon]|nr:hypothetical protein [Candidatus Lokiarchaeota archaeon]